jgi:ABC-2 type transport system permease protein
MFRNVAVGIVLGFILLWVVGFFGGSFQSYMYNMLPQSLVDLSPIYYINRTLVEFSVKGSSSYTGTCIIYLAGIILVCGILDTLLMGRKLEEQ